MKFWKFGLKSLGNQAKKRWFLTCILTVLVVCTGILVLHTAQIRRERRIQREIKTSMENLEAYDIAYETEAYQELKELLEEHPQIAFIPLIDLLANSTIDDKEWFVADRLLKMIGESVVDKLVEQLRDYNTRMDWNIIHILAETGSPKALMQ